MADDIVIGVQVVGDSAARRELRSLSAEAQRTARAVASASTVAQRAAARAEQRGVSQRIQILRAETAAERAVFMERGRLARAQMAEEGRMMRHRERMAARSRRTPGLMGQAAGWTGRRVGQAQRNMRSALYPSLMVGAAAVAGGRSFIEATIGTADDMYRSRRLLHASLGDARKVEAAYQSAIDVAAQVGPLTRAEALESMRYMVPLAGGDVDQARQLTRMAKALQVSQPEQDFGGALFALRELIGAGQVRSLRERFNISGLPTREEAQAMAEASGKTLATVYMDEFEREMNRLYGQGGTDAFTALLAADTDTVRGQAAMLRTIFQDALADIGSDGQGALNRRLDETIRRAREFVESDQFEALANRISNALADSADAMVDFIENGDQHLDKASRFLDKYGGLILTAAQIYGINFLTGGAVTSAAKFAGRSLVSAGRAGASGAFRAAAGTGMARAALASTSGMGLGGVTGAMGVGASAVVAPALAGIALVTAALLTFGHVVNSTSDAVSALNEEADERERQRERRWTRAKAGKDKAFEFGTVGESERARRQNALESIVSSPGLAGRFLSYLDPATGTMRMSSVRSREDEAATRGAVEAFFGGPRARLQESDRDLYQTLSDTLYERYGIRLSEFDEGGRVGRIGYVGGVEAMSEEDAALYRAAENNRAAAAGELGPMAVFDAMQDVILLARAERLKDMDEAMDRIFNQAGFSENLANALSSVMASTEIPVYLRGIDPNVREMERNTPGTFALSLIGVDE